MEVDGLGISSFDYTDNTYYTVVGFGLLLTIVTTLNITSIILYKAMTELHNDCKQ